MKTIKISDEVYEAIQSVAIAFVDKQPNDVLHRLLIGEKKQEVMPRDAETRIRQKREPIAKYTAEQYRGITYSLAVQKMLEEAKQPLHIKSIMVSLFYKLPDDRRRNAETSVIQTLRNNRHRFQETGKHIFDLVKNKVN